MVNITGYVFNIAIVILRIYLSCLCTASQVVSDKVKTQGCPFLCLSSVTYTGAHLPAVWGLLYSKVYIALFSLICCIQYQGDLWLIITFTSSACLGHRVHECDTSFCWESWDVGTISVLTGRLNRKNTVPHWPHALNRVAEGRGGLWPAVPWSSGF